MTNKEMEEQHWLIKLFYDVHLGKKLGIDAVEEVQKYINTVTQSAICRAEKRMIEKCCESCKLKLKNEK